MGTSESSFRNCVEAISGFNFKYFVKAMREADIQRIENRLSTYHYIKNFSLAHYCIFFDNQEVLTHILPQCHHMLTKEPIRFQAKGFGDSYITLAPKSSLFHVAIACNNISVFDILYRYDDSYCMPNTFNIQNKAGINCLMLLIIAGTGNAMKFIERFNFLYQLTSVCDIIDFSVLQVCLKWNRPEFLDKLTIWVKDNEQFQQFFKPYVEKEKENLALINFHNKEEHQILFESYQKFKAEIIK